ncbi:Phage protein [Kosakonia sp. BK9b]
MIIKEQAVEIARRYAAEQNRGWDEHYHEATPMTLFGEPVWKISTMDIKYSPELPWLMEYLPNPAYYYISMVEGRCIAIGTRNGTVHGVR